jgi:hypothetical protein
VCRDHLAGTGGQRGLLREAGIDWVGDHKGNVEDAAFGAWRGLVVSTIHPSVVLREDDPEARERSYAGLVADLVTAREAARR